LAILSPTDGEVVHTSVVYVEGTATDASGVSQVLVNGGVAWWIEPDDSRRRSC